MKGNGRMGSFCLIRVLFFFQSPNYARPKAGIRRQKSSPAEVSLNYRTGRIRETNSAAMAGPVKFRGCSYSRFSYFFKKRFENIKLIAWER
jgi:hypothetical protein